MRSLDDTVTAPHRRLKFARQQLGQRGFSLAVPAQKRDPVVLVDPQVQAAQHGRPP
jgi:hypothetical protein